jgi:hypothetical protein
MARTSVLLALALAVASPSRALGDEPIEDEPIVADEEPWVAIESERGAVVVESDAERGTVFVDGERRGSITTGTTLTISLDDGTHQIAVKVKGYERFERTIEVQDGETATFRASLVKLPPPPPPAPPPPPPPPVTFGPPSTAFVGPAEAPASSPPNLRRWRTALWASLGASAAAGAIWVFGYQQVHDANLQLCGDASGCDEAPDVRDPEEFQRLNAQGERGARLATIGAAGVMIGAGVAALSLYKIYRGKAEARSRAAVVAPLVGAERAGAVVRIDW